MNGTKERKITRKSWYKMKEKQNFKKTASLQESLERRESKKKKKRSKEANKRKWNNVRHKVDRNNEVKIKEKTPRMNECKARQKKNEVWREK